MFRTASLSAALALAAYATAAWLTHDFQVWTAEGARRIEVALHPIVTPAVVIDGAGLATRPLPQLLADGQSVTLVDFVYSRCQTVCLTLGSGYQQMQATLQRQRKAGPSAPSVNLLSISLDGQYDSPSLLSAYAARLDADPLLWRFVRVPDAQAERRLLSAFQVVVVADGRGGFEHNGALLVVDQRGRLVRIFDYDEQQMALDYAQDLVRRSAP